MEPGSGYKAVAGENFSGESWGGGTALYEDCWWIQELYALVKAHRLSTKTVNFIKCRSFKHIL